MRKYLFNVFLIERDIGKVISVEYYIIVGGMFETPKRNSTTEQQILYIIANSELDSSLSVQTEASNI